MSKPFALLGGKVIPFGALLGWKMGEITECVFC